MCFEGFRVRVVFSFVVFLLYSFYVRVIFLKSRSLRDWVNLLFFISRKWRSVSKCVLRWSFTKK